MYDNYNYPCGADNPQAPWNEPVVKEREFKVSVLQVLTKDVVISTDDYQPEFDEEYGTTFANTENTDWVKSFENVHYTPLQLIDACKKIAKWAIDNNVKRIDDLYLPRVAEDCNGWQVLEYNVDEI
jgi:hypothetical protein